MSHQTHFLSRLDRASGAEINFALSLYYDAEFTRDVITELTLPDNADRFAVALSHNKQPSHVILSRQGAFITCLAPEMRLDNIPVITKHQYVGVTKSHEKYMDKVAQIDKLAEKNKDTCPLNQSLYTGGRNMYREDFIVWTIFRPLVNAELFEMQSKMTGHTLYASKKLRSAAERGSLRTAAERKQLRRLWASKWALGNINMVAFSDSSFVKKAAPILSGEFVLLKLLMLDKMMPMNLMAMWLAAKMGNHMFPSYKKQYLEAKNHWDYIEAALIMTATAMRHNRYRAEVLKLLRRTINKWDSVIVTFCKQMDEACTLCLETPEKAYETLQIFALTSFEIEYGHFFGHPPETEIPLDLKILFAARNERSILSDPSWFISSAMFLTWLINREAHEFYIPKKYQELFYPYKEEQAMGFMEKRIVDQLKPKSLKVIKKPGRNEPCHCGSRKKYKKCCFKKDGAGRRKSV